MSCFMAELDHRAHTAAAYPVHLQGRHIALRGRLSVKHHSRLRKNQLHWERHRGARVPANIGWNCMALGLEFGANAHLHSRRDFRWLMILDQASRTRLPRRPFIFSADMAF